MPQSSLHDLETYDQPVIAKYYRWRWWPVLRRTLVVIGQLLGFYGTWQLNKISKRQEATARQLRQLLTRLGPAFIKLGQALSTRPDLVPQVYLDELTKLQDQLPGYSNVLAIATIEAELGLPPDEIYASISPQPVAAASLGQVYRGRLKSGEEVAIKVQRPRLRETLTLDLYIMRWVASWVYQWLPLNFSDPLTSVVDEFGTKLFEEIDYLHEGRNCERFAHYFENDPTVHVPQIFWRYTSRRVLTLEWIDGIKLTDTAAIRAAGLDISRLIRIGVESSLRQLLEHGFFHADPHPGNLFALRDGRLAFIDFGMMDQLSQTRKECLVDALVHMVNHDHRSLVDDFVALGFLANGSQREEIAAALAALLSNLLDQEVQNFNFKTATDRFSQLMYVYPFRVPANFALIIRSLVTLEGVALSLSPDFKIIGVAYPYVARRLLTDESPAIRQRLIEVLFDGGQFQWERMADLIQIARLDDEQLNLLTTARLGLSYLLSDEADTLRQKLVLALTEGDRLHVAEVGQLWDLVKADLAPDRLWESALQSVRAVLPTVLVPSPEEEEPTPTPLPRFRQ